MTWIEIMSMSYFISLEAFFIDDKKVSILRILRWAKLDNIIKS